MPALGSQFRVRDGHDPKSRINENALTNFGPG